MNQEERRIYLIRELLKEKGKGSASIPTGRAEQERLLRSLMNMRLPSVLSADFLQIQDEYLQIRSREKGVTDVTEFKPLHEAGLYLWKGDITKLRVDAIVNAANSGLTGCYMPCHGCIDNVIHTYSGAQLRLACAKIIEKQGYAEPTGQAKITPAYNLPCRYVLHTVGPIVSGPLTETHCRQLADCYRSCLMLASEYKLTSMAFCCISTGEFHFPQERAAEIAIRTVTDFLQTDKQIKKVVFNVFKQEDYEIYKQKLHG